MCDNVSDEIIERAKKGDSDAARNIVLCYEKLVYNIAYSILSNREDALDAAQESFIKIFKSLPSFKRESLFSTWIYKITKNTVIDLYRSKKIKQTLSADDITLYDTVSDMMGVDELVISEERREKLIGAIDELSHDHKEVIRLYHFCGKPYESIAKILGIEIGTVKSRLNRARTELRKILIRRNFL